MNPNQIEAWCQRVLNEARQEAHQDRAEFHSATILRSILHLEEDLRAAIWWLATTSTYSDLFEAEKFERLLSHPRAEIPRS